MLWNAWSEMDRLRDELDGLFSRHMGRRTGEFPPVNVYTGEEDAILTTAIPGIDPKDLDVSCRQNTVTIKGERKRLELKEGERFLRNERGAGNFVRSFTLPFKVDADGIKAEYKQGILIVKIPRAAEDKPQKIAVLAG